VPTNQDHHYVPVFFKGHGVAQTVMGAGPQLSFLFPVAGMQGSVNLKEYTEFNGFDRPSGYNVWLTFAITPEAPTMPKPVIAKY
jgi:hypothetical protein